MIWKILKLEGLSPASESGVLLVAVIERATRRVRVLGATACLNASCGIRPRTNLVIKLAS